MLPSLSEQLLPHCHFALQRKNAHSAEKLKRALRLNFLLTAAIVILIGQFRSGAAAGFDGIPGDYCKYRRPTCCPNRDDDCTVKILDTLCYCDMFCDRPLEGSDCCPDFQAVCKGAVGQAPPPSSKIQGDCVYNDIRHNIGDKIKQNCNKCTCAKDPQKPGGSRWFCEDNACLIQEDILQSITEGSSRYTWQAKNYSDFWGLTLTEGVLYRLGTLYPERSVENMNELLVKPLTDIPDRFDAREKWPGYIHPVRDQANCGSSWAFSTTTLSADRLAIQSDGRLNSVLSAQQLISCNQHRQKGCEGGYLDRAWWYIRKLGVVSEDCYPYESGKTNEPGSCKISKAEQHKNSDGIRCPSGSADNKIFKMTPPYRLSKKVDEIQTEIMTNGPVQATFLVHEDFYLYSSGVYRHTKLAANKGGKFEKSGFHSVRLIGWGQENINGEIVKYWLAANSWGQGWGESGYFKIARGEDHSQIESFVIGAWGKGEKKKKKKRRLRHSPHLMRLRRRQ